MAVFRIHKTDNYTVMSNHHLRDNGLSLSAKGLLSVILSLPPDWKYSVRGLAQISKEGEQAIRTAINELRDSGYVVVSRINPEPGNGHIRYVYDIYEVPRKADVDAENVPETEKPQVGQAYASQGTEEERIEQEGSVGQDAVIGAQLNTYGLTSGAQIIEQSITDDGFKKQRAKSAEPHTEIVAIIDHLNEKLGTRYTYRNKAFNKLINARLSEGFTTGDLLSVIDKKCDEWIGTEWQKFLVPTTLFAQSHFETYLNQTMPQGRSRRDYSEYDRAFGV